jgi:hypothetical protein
MAEGILKAPDEFVGGLPVNDLAVCLARVGQHDPKEMGPAALAIGPNDPCACAEVDLRLVTGTAFEAAERQLACRHQSADESPDAVIVPGEIVLGDQILVDALCAEPEIALCLNDAAPELALAAATAAARSV